MTATSQATSAPAAAANRPAVPEQAAGKKIAIVGYTASKSEAPWGVDGWEIWVVNNLWKHCPDKWHRLYDLHPMKEIVKDREHDAFLQGQPQKHITGSDIALGTRPVYTFAPLPEWKTAQKFPRETINDALGRYFTNSISWMIAHALMEMKAEAEVFATAGLEHFKEEASAPAARKLYETTELGLTIALQNDYMARCELHVYGVDLATGGEYSAQRPSCEWMLGIAQGMGVKLHIPLSSDLLKLASMYGAEDDSALYAKIKERIKELGGRGQQLDQGIDQQRIARAQIQGALETTQYFESVWCNPRANRDGTPKELVNGNGKVREPEKVLANA